MLIIADSGSTKCDWRLVASDKSFRDFKSIGINPYFHDEAFIEAELLNNEGIAEVASQVTHVFFYGAGCSSRTMKSRVERGLSRVFENAEIAVDHDLVAAALSVYDGEPCIACILGTGSNTCHFDGDIVREEVPALSFILGDEGSGAYFGKKLLADFLYKKLPAELHDGLAERYQLNKDVIFDKVYMKPNPNVYLASFMRFITEFKDMPYVKALIRGGLQQFLSIHVMCFRDYTDTEAHFIGSVAYYHEDTLREVAESLGVKVGKILKKPIDGLYEYHIRTHFSKIPFKS